MTAPTVVRPTADEMTQAAALAAEMGRTPTSNELRKRLGVGREVANRIRAELDQSLTGHQRATPAGHPANGAGHPALIVVPGVVEFDGDANAGPVARADRATDGPVVDLAVHPAVHPGPDAADGDTLAVTGVARELPQFSDGGPAQATPTGHSQATPGHPATLDVPEHASNDAGTPDRASFGPGEGYAGHPAGHPQATPVVDRPVGGPDTADTSTPELDHSTERAAYGPVADSAGHPQATGRTDAGRLVRWLRRGLFVIALPAFVATWSGWVGVGELTGFGPVNLLPGFGDGLTVNSAITLPLGVEAYVALAMGAWLSGVPMATGARKFAMVSSLISLSLGMGAQVAYHLIVAGGAAHAAPWGVTVVVSCLPNLVMGMAAALIHLLRKGDDQ